MVHILDVTASAIIFFQHLSQVTKLFNNLIMSNCHIIFIFTFSTLVFISLTYLSLIFEHFLCTQYLHFWHSMEFLITLFLLILRVSTILLATSLDVLAPVFIALVLLTFTFNLMFSNAFYHLMYFSFTSNHFQQEPN